ncbi:MAG: hypothetical protein IJ231_01310 [Clostridia bacterium]|nr:hypothetical protein [Clostridia bacterium]
MIDPHLIARTAPVAAPQNQVIWKHLRITVLGERLFRLEALRETGEQGEKQGFCDEATQTVWFRNMPPVPFQHAETEAMCVVETAKARMEVIPELWESRVQLKRPDGSLEDPVRLADDARLPGTYRTLDNFNGRIKIPYGGDLTRAFEIVLDKGVTSRNGVAVLDDSGTLILGPDGMPCSRTGAETDLYVFAYGHDYRAAVQALFMLCQAPPVIPRFALGNWWSRYHAYTQKEYLDLMDSFADRGIPFTVATVDMDWHPSHDLPGGADGWTGYSWNRSLFPDYRGFLRSLHERNLRVTLNLHPALGVRSFEDPYPEMAARMGIDPESGKTIAFDLTNEKFINAYFDVLHKPYEHEGVDFWWIDWQQGEASALAGLDPLWALNHYHWLDMAREREGLILSRYAGVGSHRYPIGFSGDTHMTWDTLRFLPEFTACATNVGYTWWSHDIGGHMLGYKDDELYVRFIQFGVFSPINRIHSSDNPMLVKDPAYYPGGAGLIAREFLRMRHAMLPFLYTASRRTAEEGLALIEPMYYGWPEEPDAYACPGQYLFGQQMIAAPITEKTAPCGTAVKDVWLPEGSWVDVFTGSRYRGGGWRRMVRGLDRFPLLLKEGGFLVLDGAPEGNSILLPKRLRVLLAGGDGEYTLEEEENGNILRTFFRMKRADADTLQVRIRTGRAMSLDLESRTTLEGEASLTVNGQSMPCAVRRRMDYTVVQLGEIPAMAEVEIVIRETADGTEQKKAAAERALLPIQCDNGVKADLYARMLEVKTRMEYRALVSVSGLSEHDCLRMLEEEDAFSE